MSTSPDIDTLFSASGLQECKNLANHLQWQQGFGLYFVFISHPTASLALRDYLAIAVSKQVTPLQTFTPKVSATLTEDVLQLVQQSDAVFQQAAAPLWLGLNQAIGTDWDAARENLLRRLNERRESLRSHLARSLLIVLPLHFFSRCAQLAPDLWSIKGSCAVFDSVSYLPVNQGAAINTPIEPVYRPETALDEAQWQEWARVQHGAASVDQLYAAWEAIESALQVGKLALAQEVATAAVQLARSLGNSPEQQRNLAISLVYQGDVATANNHWDAAELVYTESLQIRRELRAQFGNDQQVLRDLSVALERVGDVATANNRLDVAELAYIESLQIRRELRIQFGDTPRVLRDLSISLSKVADVAKANKHWDAAELAYTESLQIRRELRAQFGDNPQVLRDLSFALERVADLAVANKHWDTAEMAYTESLKICRELRVQLGDTPQVLRDLSIALQRVGELAIANKHWDLAEPTYTECLQICRELRKQLGDTPQVLEDLCIALKILADTYHKLSNLAAAKPLYAEALQISQRLHIVFPESQDYAFRVADLTQILAELVTDQ